MLDNLGMETGSVGEDTGPGSWDSDAQQLVDSGDPGLDSGDTAGGEDSGEEELSPEEDAYWTGVSLEILSPASGEFIEWGETARFEAALYDAEGNEIVFEDIEWTSSVDESWSVVLDTFYDDGLDVGEHNLTATARLPNGDRVSYSVGGVLVQSIYAGTYTGTVVVQGSYDAYSIGCSGAATLYIDAYGDAVTGDSSCIISLQGFELDFNFNYDLENDQGALEGDSNLEVLGWFDLPTEMEGSVNRDGELEADFNFEISSDFGVSGEVRVERLSREVLD